MSGVSAVYRDPHLIWRFNSRTIQLHLRCVDKNYTFVSVFLLTWKPSYVQLPNFMTQVCSSKGKYSTSISQEEW